MPTLAKYKIDLELTTAKFKRQIGGVTNSMKSLGRQARTVGNILGAVLPAGGLVGIATMTRQAIDAQASLYEMSQRLGVTTEGLSRLQYAAEQSGVSAETLNMGLQRMTRRVSEAANGSGEAVKALDELGISAKKLTTIAPEEQFKVLADAIMNVEDPAARVRLAMKLFDSEGVSLIQTMQGGSKAIEAMGKEADDLGLTVGTKAAKASKDATDAFARLSGTFTGIANTLATQFAPEMEAAANYMAQQVPVAAQATVDAMRAVKNETVGIAESIAAAIGGPAFDDVERRQAKIAALQEKIAARSGTWFTPDEAIERWRKELADLEAQQRSYEQFNKGLKKSTDANTASIDKYNAALVDTKYNYQDFIATSSTASQKAADEAQRAFQAVVEGLKTEEEKILESFHRRREIIIQNTEAESALRIDLMNRLHDELLPQIENQAAERAKAFYRGMNDGKGPPKLDEIAGAWESALGQMTSATQQFAGEQSGIYKAMFAVEKAAAIARSIIAIQTGIAQASANPYPANLIAMANVAAATASIISTISSTQFGGGRAMGGNVDAGKSYLVGERGPEMFMPQSSGTIIPNNQLQQAPQVNVRLVNIESTDGYENWASSGRGEQVFINHLQRNKRLLQSLVA